MFSVKFSSLLQTATLSAALAANACASSAARPLPSPVAASAERSCAGGVIANAADAARFVGCTRIDGDLQVVRSELTDLAPLGELRSVSGKLEVTENSRLEELTGLERLEQVGELSIAHNPELAGLSGLSRLHTASRVSLRDNPELVTLRGLDGLVTVERLVLDHNGLYNTGGLGALEQVGELVIRNNARLNSLQQLRSLSHAGWVEIRKNPLLCAHGMLPALTHVERGLDVRENRGLAGPELRGLLDRVERGAPRPQLAGLQASLR